MKTKILIITLFATILGFATQAQAQQVLQFTNVVQGNGEVKAKIYVTKKMQVKFKVLSQFSGGSGSIFYNIAHHTLYHNYTYPIYNAYNNVMEESKIVSLWPGYNDIHCRITSNPSNVAHQGYLMISSVEYIEPGSGPVTIGHPSYVMFYKM